MTQSFSDDFNRADGAIGAAWTNITATHTIASNTAAPSTTNTCLSVYATSCDTDDNYSQATISTLAGSAQRVVCRLTDANNWYALFSNGTSIQLQKFVAGSLTSIGSAFSVTIASGDIIKVQAVGSTIKGYLNGVERCSATDTGLTTGKLVGIRSGSGGSTLLRWDDWSGGDVASGASLSAAATVTATDTVTSAIAVTRPVAATVTETATITAAAASTFNAAATRTTTATITADVAVTRPAQATVTETATITATASIQGVQTIDATRPTTATITAAAALTGALSASVSELATVLATASLNMRASASVLGTATITAAASVVGQTIPGTVREVSLTGATVREVSLSTATVREISLGV